MKPLRFTRQSLADALQAPIAMDGNGYVLVLNRAPEHPLPHVSLSIVERTIEPEVIEITDPPNDWRESLTVPRKPGQQVWPPVTDSATDTRETVPSGEAERTHPIDTQRSRTHERPEPMTDPPSARAAKTCRYWPIDDKWNHDDWRTACDRTLLNIGSLPNQWTYCPHCGRKIEVVYGTG